MSFIFLMALSKIPVYQKYNSCDQKEQNNMSVALVTIHGS